MWHFPILQHSQRNLLVNPLPVLSDAARSSANAPPLTSPLSYPLSLHVLSQRRHLHIDFPNVFTPCLSLATSCFSPYRLQFRCSCHGSANALPTSLPLIMPHSMSWLCQRLAFLSVSYIVLLPGMALPMLTLPLYLSQRPAPCHSFANALPSSMSFTMPCSCPFSFVMCPLPVSLALYSCSLWLR